LENEYILKIQKGTAYSIVLTNLNNVFSNYMVSLPSTGSYDVTSLGALEIELNIPAVSVAIPAGVSHTTSYPSFLPTYTGQFHGGYSTPSYAYAELNLEAINVSTGVVVGRTTLGTAYAISSYNVGNYYIGTYDEVTFPGGGSGPSLVPFESVTGDTKITLLSGEIILAENVTEGQKILAWSWNNQLDDSTINQFDEFEITQIKKRKVDKIYKVSAGDKTIKVSDSHGFWLNDNQQIKTTDLISGESMINIKDGNDIKLVLVDSVEIIETDEWVYTFGVPGVHNYISNDIISHNSGTWEYIATNTQSGFQINVSPQSNVIRSINITSTGPIRFRYSIRFYGSSGQRANIGSSINSYSFEFQPHTVGPTLANTPSYDTLLNVSVPSNFVEIKAGGIQVVSTPDTYVRIPRKEEGSANQEVFKAAGGISYFEKTVGLGVDTTTAISSKGDIIPDFDSLYNVGTNSYRWANVWSDNLNGVDISGLAVGTLPSGPATTTTDTDNVNTTYQSYVKLPGGVIMQWGHIYDTTGPRSVSFPTTFPNAVNSVVCSTQRSTAGSQGFNHVYNYDRAGCNLVLDANYGFWIAIGW
jgi:hypothetical protein